MLAGLFVVLLVEAADQLLEDGAHAVVVQAAGRQVEVGVEELLDQAPRASALVRRGIWLRNSKLSRISWTLGEKPSR